MSMEWPVRPDWLAQTYEPALDPDLPIIDAHHHLWKLPHDTYLLADLLADMGGTPQGHRFIGTVFAECGAMYRQDGPAKFRSLGEIEFANGIGAQAASGAFGPSRICAALVGSADPMLGHALGEVLDIQMSRAPERYRGIRPIVAADPHGVLDPWPSAALGQMASAAFIEGARQLARRNLTLDLWVFHHQIPEVTALARAVPDLTIILDHIGTPLGMGHYADRGDSVRKAWQAAVTDLATCPNVVVKLGGMHMHFNGFDWHKSPLPPTSDQLVAATRSYYLTAIDLFGPDRCMFESNFPMDKRACGYTVLWNAHKKIVQDFSLADRNKLFSQTAARIYRIFGLPGHST